MPGFVLQGGCPNGNRHRKPRLRGHRDAAALLRVQGRRLRDGQDGARACRRLRLAVLRDLRARRGERLPAEYGILGHARDEESLATIKAIDALAVSDGPPSEPVTIVEDDRRGDRRVRLGLLVAPLVAITAAALAPGALADDDPAPRRRRLRPLEAARRSGTQQAVLHASPDTVLKPGAEGDDRDGHLVRRRSRSQLDTGQERTRSRTRSRSSSPSTSTTA